MKLYDIVKWDEGAASVNDIVSYKHEAEDFNTHTQLIVHQSQEAIFFKDGRALDLFEAGKHTLKSQNLPLLGKLMSIPTGGETPFHCEVFFVNKIYMTDLRWGTPNPIQIFDPVEETYVNVRANGGFAAHIEDSRKFLTKVVGTRDIYKKPELEGYLFDKLIEKVTDILGNTMTELGVSVFGIASHYSRLSDAIKEELATYFADFGIGLDLFSFKSINVPQEEMKALNEDRMMKRKMRLEAEAKAHAMRLESQELAAKREREGYTYQQERGYDVMGTAAANEGMSGTMMGAGMGLGMGAGMGGMFGMGMASVAQQSFQDMQKQAQPQQAQAQAPQGGVKCPDCGADLPAGSKFCTNCGKRLGNACPNCGAEVAPGAKFCTNCGHKLSSNCPNCGAEVAPGSKFCTNCGQKL